MEKICLAIPTELLFKEEKFEGYATKEFYNYLDVILNSKHQKFLFRYATSKTQKIPAEQDPAYKQAIAYILLVYNNQIFIYERPPKGATSEERYASKLSLGIGGHIEPHDHNPDINLIDSSLQREIKEEIGLNPQDYDLHHVGYINDESDEIGLVHFGLIYLAKVKKNKLKIEQKELVKSWFISQNDLKKPDIYPHLEGWSKILVNNIDKISNMF